MEQTGVFLKIGSMVIGAAKILIEFLTSVMKFRILRRSETNSVGREDVNLINPRPQQIPKDPPKKSAFGNFGTQCSVGSNEWLEQKAAEAEYRGERLTIFVEDDE